MIATEAVVAKKLKIKLPSKRIEADPQKQTCGIGQQFSGLDECGHNAPMDGRDCQEMSESHKCMIRASVGKKIFTADYSKQKSSKPGAKKRGPPELLESQKEKRQKMNRGVTQQCCTLLKAVMGHPAGWVFNQPVDPVKYNIPDYFTIIANPMDLGTIKSKLDKNIYNGAEEFASDVRLTFSNAMLYNPSTNNVHKMAEELNGIFEAKWKSLEEKWNHERTKFGQVKVMSGQTKETNDTRQNCPRTPPLQNKVLPKRPKSSEEKALKISLNVRASKVKLPKPAHECGPKLLEESFQKGTDNGGRHAFGSFNAKPSGSSVAPRCGACGNISCQCSLHSDSTLASSDISSETSLRRDHCDVQAKSTVTSQMSKSDPDSVGAVSTLDDEYICPSSQIVTPATDATSGEGTGWETPLFDVHLSAEKALRAAILKKRFADTILKAKQKKLLDQADPVKLRQDKEMLERRQREEKARIEAQIRAAEAASRVRKELELKKQREKEREAARIAVEKMERTVDLEQNLLVLKQLEELSGGSLYSDILDCEVSGLVIEAFEGTRYGSPLERLGLVRKDDCEDLEEDDEVILNGREGEEGEIFS